MASKATHNADSKVATQTASSKENIRKRRERSKSLESFLLPGRMTGLRRPQLSRLKPKFLSQIAM